MEEEELIELSQNGDASAFSELVKKYNEKVYLFILKKSRNEDIAKEVTQVAWVKAWNKIDSFRGACRFSSWVCRIAFNFFRDHYRKNKRYVYMEDLLTPSVPSPADNLTGSFDNQALRWLEKVCPTNYKLTTEAKGFKGLCMSELGNEIEKAKNKLSPEHRAALELAVFEGLEYQEAADKLGCPIGTIMSRVHYARKHMRKELKGIKNELSI
jgi:RNA polymerase sigma-70 factor (ECF subfamily)